MYSYCKGYWKGSSLIVGPTHTYISIMSDEYKYARHTLQRVLLEAYAKAAIGDAQAGAEEAIKFGIEKRSEQGVVRHLYAEFRAPIGQIRCLTLANSSPNRKYRVYFSEEQRLVAKISSSVLNKNWMSNRDFVDFNGGIIVQQEGLGLTIHTCCQGCFMLFDESMYPWFVANLRIGTPLPRDNKFRDAPVEQTPLRAEIGWHVLECIKLYNNNHPETITLGKQSGAGLPFFFQFSLDELANYGGVANTHKEVTECAKTRPIRIYIKTTPEDMVQIGCARQDLLDDPEFVKDNEGRVYGPEAIGIELHACPSGIWLFYDESFGEFGVYEAKMGLSRHRMNSYRAADMVVEVEEEDESS